MLTTPPRRNRNDLQLMKIGAVVGLIFLRIQESLFRMIFFPTDSEFFGVYFVSGENRCLSELVLKKKGYGQMRIVSGSTRNIAAHKSDFIIFF